MVGADADRYRPRRTKPPALGSAPSALPRLETSLAPGGRSLIEGLDDPPCSGRLGLRDLNEPLAHAPLVLAMGDRGGPVGGIPGKGSTDLAGNGPPRTRDYGRSHIRRQRR